MTRPDFDATRQQQLVERFLCDSAHYFGLAHRPGRQRRQGGAADRAVSRRFCVDPQAPFCRCAAALGV